MKKLKGSSDSIKLKYLLFLFAASLLILLPVRVYQLLAVVETETGFFAEKDATVYLVYALVLLFPLVFLALSYLSREVPSPKLPAGKNPVLGVSSLIMAAGLVFDIISTEKQIIPPTQANFEIFTSVFKSNVMQAGGFFMLLRLVFAFFAIIYFAVFAVSHLNGRASYKEYKVLALAPLCWATTKLVSNLMHAISFLRVSELLFEIFMLVFLMLFFMTFARISSGVFTEDSMWGIYGYGLCSSLFAALVTVPRIVMLAVGKNAVKGNELNPADITCMVFILCYIFASFGVGFKDGIKNRKSVSDVALPDEDSVVKKSEDFESETNDGDSYSENFNGETVVFEKVFENAPFEEENVVDIAENYDSVDESDENLFAEVKKSFENADADAGEVEDDAPNYEEQPKKKRKKLFGKNETENEEEVISSVSLADLKNKKDN